MPTAGRFCVGTGPARDDSLMCARWTMEQLGLTFCAEDSLASRSASQADGSPNSTSGGCGQSSPGSSERSSQESSSSKEQRDDLRRGQREETVGVAADADGQGQSQPRWTDRAVRGWASDSGWRHAPPAVRGVDDGPSDGLDGPGRDGPGRDRGEAREPATQAPDTWRVSACGNAVVPQVAEIVGRAIVDACEWRAT